MRAAIEQFLCTAGRFALLEPGEDMILIKPDNFTLEARGSFITLSCWTDTRNLVRKIRKVHVSRTGRLELEYERFGGMTGTLTLLDLAHPSNRDAPRRGARLKYRETFRRSLRRQFVDWKLMELSAEQDLEHSLSPAFPRAMLKRGNTAWAAIGAGDDAGDPSAALSFGLIWLDYLRKREKKVGVEGLAIFVPSGKEEITCHRVRWLDPQAARYRVFIHFPDGSEDSVDPCDYTNLRTKLASPGEEPREVRVNLGPEAWLESQVRANIQQIDAVLQPEPVYGQVAQFAGCERGIIDLLAVDYRGRLTIVELKASQDIHLPLQALDYWMRVNWHIEQGDLIRAGYFSGIDLRREPPRLLLVAPALDYHPSNETILRFFSQPVDVERIGVGMDWRSKLEVMFRAPKSIPAIQ
jgi:hypothetical protein